MKKVVTIMCMVHCFFLMVYAGDNPNQFLAELSDKKSSNKIQQAASGQAATKKKSSSSASVQNFLGSISSPKQESKEEAISTVGQEQAADEKLVTQATIQQNLAYQNTPEYQAAMKILNDTSLQQEYEQNLQNIHMKFFQYTQKMLREYHTSDKTMTTEEVQQKSVNAFMQSLHEQKSQQPSAQQIDSEQTAKPSQEVNSFLASVKG